jgi:hypothetical protein
LLPRHMSRHKTLFRSPSRSSTLITWKTRKRHLCPVLAVKCDDDIYEINYPSGVIGSEQNRPLHLNNKNKSLCSSPCPYSRYPSSSTVSTCSCGTRLSTWQTYPRFRHYSDWRESRRPMHRWIYLWLGFVESGSMTLSSSTTAIH